MESMMPLTADFGRKCLLARRLVERGVRFIQLYSGTNVGEDWDDAHNDLSRRILAWRRRQIVRSRVCCRT